MRASLIALACAACIALAAFHASSVSAQSASPSAAPTFVPYDPHALPTGPVGDAIRLGHDIIDDPQKYLKANVTAGMSCSACHLAVGTRKNAGTFVGTYARFPQWNKRSKRVITLQDRLAECFLYSMNGSPPAYQSKAMIAMTAYIAYLSRGVPVGTPADPKDSIMVPLPKIAPNIASGKVLYTNRCEGCHGANGAGIPGAVPPLWGKTSFNNGAGMAHVDRMTGFVYHNMPKDEPGTLTVDQAYNISAYVLSHERPTFNAKRAVQWPPDPASYF